MIFILVAESASKPGSCIAAFREVQRGSLREQDSVQPDVSQGRQLRSQAHWDESTEIHI